MPEGWAPTAAHRELAAKKGVKALDDEGERFRAHHLAKGSLFADWDAAFRTWIMNAERYAPAQRSLGAGQQPARPGDYDWRDPEAYRG